MNGSFNYTKIHIKSRQRVKNLTHEETTRIAGEDPDYMIRDMYEAIERKEFPDSAGPFVRIPRCSSLPSWRQQLPTNVAKAPVYCYGGALRPFSSA
ncbi:Peroxisomal catalase A [Penicillium subrubescens]|uniref:Peroxisomal catalase A n=1 Tax=Penicillium subrubescens TaxID=1316194 RepID=A0A1Q5U5X5_9EURO|nr:Peroxisomal catalase A [Penicillium subrubescens]